MNNELPIVSIVTPTYNQSRFISETIESVLKQDYNKIEYMILNDGSTDNTEEILKKYNGKVIWETQKNMGQTPTINKGWKKSKGSILAYINSDDTYYDSNSVSIAVNFLKNNPEVGIVYGDSIYIDENGKELGKYNAYDFDYNKIFRECSNPIPQPSVFIRREVVEKVDYLDEKLYYSMDFDFWLRAGIEYKIVYIPYILSTYRLHLEAKSVSSMAKAASDVIYIYNKLFSIQNLPECLKAEEKSIMGCAYLLSAQQYFMGKDWSRAKQSFKKVLKLNSNCMNFRHYVKFILSFLLSLINKK